MNEQPNPTPALQTKKRTSLLRKCFYTLIGMILIFIIVGLFLPTTFHAEKTVTINATADKIFPFINSPKTWSDWSAWNTKSHPTLKYQYEGPISGVGATSIWTDDSMKNPGKTVITQSMKNKAISYTLSMGGQEMQGEIILTTNPQNPQHTDVTWKLGGDIGNNIIVRYFYAAGQVKLWIEQDFQTGLLNLKADLAGEPRPLPPNASEDQKENQNDKPKDNKTNNSKSDTDKPTQK